jgi:hypothetical protein
VTSDITFEGEISLLGSYTDNIEIKATGSGRGNLDENEFFINSLLALEFEIPGVATEVMGFDFLETVELTNPPEAEDDKTALLYKIAPVLGDKVTKDYEERSFEEYLPLSALGSSIISDVVISNVDLSWSESNLSWYNTSKAGLSHILRTDINAEIDGFIEIRKELDGDVVNVFLMAAPACWYFFSYENNSLIAFSSNPGFNSVIASKSNAAKAKIGDYVFSEGNLEETEGFVNRFRSLYYGIEDLFYLEMKEAADDDSFEAFESSDDEYEEEDYIMESEPLSDDDFPTDEASEMTEEEPVTATGKKKKAKKSKKQKDKKDKEGFDAFPVPQEETDDDDKEGF